LEMCITIDVYLYLFSKQIHCDLSFDLIDLHSPLLLYKISSFKTNRCTGDLIRVI